MATACSSNHRVALHVLAERTDQVGLRVRVSTNGVASKLRTSDFRRLVDDQRVEWRISLDSHIPREHERFRGSGTFARTLRNLDYLQACGANVSIKTVLSDENCGGLADYIRFADVRGFNVSYSMVDLVGEASRQSLQRRLTHLDILESLLGVYATEPWLLRRLRPSPLGHLLANLYVRNESYYPRFQPFLHWDGRVFPMDLLLHDEFCIGHDGCVDVEALLDLHRRFELSPPRCGRCSVEPFCYRGNFDTLWRHDRSMTSQFTGCPDFLACIARLMGLGSRGRDLARIVLGVREEDCDV